MSDAAAPPKARPIHTLYGGAHRFSADAVPKLGRLAREFWQRWCAEPSDLPRFVGRPIDAPLAVAVHAAVSDKLGREPIEDYRVDFEDGFGVRGDREEDEALDRVVEALAVLSRDADRRPRWIGARVRRLVGATAARGRRTLTRLVEGLGTIGWQGDFLVTIPKVETVKEVDFFVKLLDELEAAAGLRLHSLRGELMIESPGAVLGVDGRVVLPDLAAAAGARLHAMHVGAYDYTGLLGVAGRAQRLDHPAVELLRQLLCLLPGVPIADGATNLLPLPPHAAPTSPAEQGANQRVVLQATRTHARHIEAALHDGIYQGWDLHPAQVAVRYAATYLYFREALPEVEARLASFVRDQESATRTGAIFDDAATAQGLRTFFERGRACGALPPG